MSSDQALIRSTACAVVDKLNCGEVTPLDLLDVLERRIAEVDSKVNALPIRCFDRARKQAQALMQKPKGHRGLLAGLPPLRPRSTAAAQRAPDGDAHDQASGGRALADEIPRIQQLQRFIIRMTE